MSNNIFEDGLNYEGKVTLTLKSDDHILSVKTFKNNGTALLFKFLGHCLIGHYKAVEDLLPTKIALLFNASGMPASADPEAVSAVSSFIGIRQLPSVVSTSNPAEVKVTYNFEVPRSAVFDNFNQVALYGNGVEDARNESDIKSFSAYYYLTDGEAFDTQAINNWSTTTVLLIDWELSISNKNTITEGEGE